MIRIDDLLRIPDPRVRLDRYMELQGGRVVSATDRDFMLLFSWEISAAEDALAAWASRHRDDCETLGMNPARIKVYGTVMPDLEKRSRFDRRARARRHAGNRFPDGKEWDRL